MIKYGIKSRNDTLELVYGAVVTRSRREKHLIPIIIQDREYPMIRLICFIREVGSGPSPKVCTIRIDSHYYPQDPPSQGGRYPLARPRPSCRSISRQETVRVWEDGGRPTVLKTGPGRVPCPQIPRHPWLGSGQSGHLKGLLFT